MRDAIGAEIYPNAEMLKFFQEIAQGFSLCRYPLIRGPRHRRPFSHLQRREPVVREHAPTLALPRVLSSLPKARNLNGYARALSIPGIQLHLIGLAHLDIVEDRF